MAVQAFNPCTLEAEEGGKQVQMQLGRSKVKTFTKDQRCTKALDSFLRQGHHPLVNKQPQRAGGLGPRCPDPKPVPPAALQLSTGATLPSRCLWSPRPEEAAAGALGSTGPAAAPALHCRPVGSSLLLLVTGAEPAWLCYPPAAAPTSPATPQNPTRKDRKLQGASTTVKDALSLTEQLWSPHWCLHEE